VGRALVIRDRSPSPPLPPRGGAEGDEEELPPPPPNPLPSNVEKWVPTATSKVAFACARSVIAASKVLTALPGASVAPAVTPALPSQQVPGSPLPCGSVVPGLSLPPKPVVEWHHPSEPSWTLFRLNDVPELESWDVLRGEGESAVRQLRRVQEMLSTAATSVAGTLWVLTHEVVRPAR
jgi:hypothetical protein